jgi:hypothetical protein
MQSRIIIEKKNNKKEKNKMTDTEKEYVKTLKEYINLLGEGESNEKK